MDFIGEIAKKFFIKSRVGNKESKQSHDRKYKKAVRSD
jgi:hypothetical protein